MNKPIESEEDLTPMQKAIIDLVEDGYTMRFRDTWSLTYGKGDQRVTVHHDGTTTAFTVAAEG
jgi:hypothetical protein